MRDKKAKIGPLLHFERKNISKKLKKKKKEEKKKEKKYQKS